MFKIVFSLILMTLFAAPAWAAPGWGCKAATVTAGKTTSGCLRVDGRKRSYRMHVPPGIAGRDTPVPLLVAFHGGGGKPARFEAYTRLSEFSDEGAGFITVYPAGIDKHWNDGRDNVNADVDDVRFFEALLEHVRNDLELPVDSNSVYVAGMSNGGLMALRLACEKPALIAGAAVVAASMTEAMAANCHTGAAPVAMLFIFGDQDTAFLADGRLVNPVKPAQQRGTHIGIDGTVSRWAATNGCSGEPVKKAIDTDSGDKTRVVRYRYHNCDKVLVHYQVVGGGHRWPDRQAGNGRLMVKALNLGVASHDIDAGRVIADAITGSDVARR